MKTMKYFLIALVALFVVSGFAGTRLFDTSDIPFPHAMEPFLENHLEQYLNAPKFGDMWFVDASASTGIRTGKTVKNAFTNLTDAIAAADTNDVIYVSQGDYEEDGVLNITQDGLRIICVRGMLNQNVAMIYVADSSNHAMTINANNVEIAGLGFTVNKDTYSAIMVSTTASKYKVWIHHCRFDGYGQGEYGVHTGTTYDSPDIVVENNVFRSWQTSAIYANATRGIYRNNIIHTVAAKNGIEYIPTTSSRPDGVIAGNIIHGVNSTDTGIKITNSPNENALTITGNDVTNCATPITSGKYTTWYENNFWGIDDAKYHREDDTFYVQKGATANGDGKCWASAYDTIATAITAINALIDWGGSPWADTYTLKIDAGSYNENLTALPYGCRIIGMGEAFDADGETGVRIKPSSGAPVDVNACINSYIYNINFEAADASRVFDAAILNNVRIEHCRFAGAPEATTATAGIYTNDSVMLTVEDSRFTYVDCGIDVVYADGGDSFTRAVIKNNYFTYISEAGIRVSTNLVTPSSTIGPGNVIHGGSITCAIGIDDNSTQDNIGVFGNFIDATDAIQGISTNVGGNYVGGSSIE